MLLGLTVLVAMLGAAGWLLSSLVELHDRFSRESRGLGIAFLVVLIVLLSFATLWVGRLLWVSRKTANSRAQAPADVIEAASVQTEQAEGVIRRVEDPSARAGLSHELSAIRAGKHRREFHVVVFGTGSAGKTSLASALLGREAGKSEAVMGTTQRAENHTYSVDGVDGSLFLTDTPGLSEIGEAGSAREREARDLAARADLLIFVLDHDLTRTEYEPLAALVHQGKRSIVFFNKTDRFNEQDGSAILAKLK
jgi:small GTP-binding protein